MSVTVVNFVGPVGSAAGSDHCSGKSQSRSAGRRLEDSGKFHIAALSDLDPVGSSWVRAQAANEPLLPVQEAS